MLWDWKHRLLKTAFTVQVFKKDTHKSVKCENDDVMSYM